MFRNALATIFVLGVATPALAQEPCDRQVQNFWANVQQMPNITEDQMGQAANALNGALSYAKDGDEEACLATLEQVKVALNVQE